ncbi:hypothetical protein HYH03_004527 [Edaphochlamys debaryana]|uniref:Cilia- and flagella-associated protein 418 n=1 Tax=Edaphochlamys debaryana TaxID=47281 RepID=A0A835Y918_9CHLO|nr:hypothetical protein HYH03_004527 [Edaphochlamys debaryana]|eukprot:KAG2497369.1 hypothetical protein HYH03_004527 [Edaphochlamys debaryana]
MSFGVDDLLKELDDLPGQRGAGRVTAAASTGGNPHHRSGSTPPVSSHESIPNTPSSSKPAAQQYGSHSRTRSVSGTTPKPKDELEALLSDFDFGGTPTSTSTAAANGRPAAKSEVQTSRAAPGSGGGAASMLTKHSSNIASKQKCTGVFLGGTSYGRGRMGAVGNLICCDALRCTKCDFRVEWFHNREWDGDVDYLFFRNNFPTESKLAPKMRSRPGCVAYCCQCSWLSVVDQTKLDFSSELRWVCAGHLTA